MVRRIDAREIPSNSDTDSTLNYLQQLAAREREAAAIEKNKDRSRTQKQLNYLRALLNDESNEANSCAGLFLGPRADRDISGGER